MIHGLAHESSQIDITYNIPIHVRNNRVVDQEENNYAPTLGFSRNRVQACLFQH